MNAAERRVLEHIDHDEMKQFIMELVSIPSYEGEETPAQKFMAEKLASLGFDVDTWMIDFDELSKHPQFSMSYQRIEGMGVVGSMGDGERSIMLCGHIDTVAPGDTANWNTDPLKATEKDGRLYGRGVCDMKGGLAAGLYALKAIKDSGVKLKGKTLFATTIGEEDGGCGALATSLRGHRADAAVIMEPSEVKIAPSVAGAMSFRVTVQGKSVHACVREEGVSAIDKFIDLVNGLKELEIQRNSRITDPLYQRYKTPYAISVGTVKGGQWPGSVPENLVFEGRLGVAVGESEMEARAEFEQKVKEIADNDPWLKENPPKVEWVGYSFASSMVPKEHAIVQKLVESLRDVTGQEPVLEGMTYASDARLLINVGKTPTIVFGPGDIRVAHGPNEYASIEDLRVTVQTLALTVMRFLGYES
ncbi:MAG: ArgE/DapE family deacylase [Candidatus Bathyarchaeota archaeon]|nr:ArgE/DapE family deacylase [Candidatus Bathyarchaeota archaeon]